MKKQDVVIFGMGRLGSSIAKQLEANGCSVLAVDNDERKVRQIADNVTVAICADVTDEEAMDQLGIHNFDTAIIAIGHNTEASVLATISVKEHGVKHVIASAFNDIHGRILTKVGADEIISPERDMGIRIANNLTMNNLIDAIELTEEYSIVKLQVLPEWVGKNLKTLNLRNKYQINVIAVQKNGTVQMIPNAEEPICEDDTFVILGANEMLRKLERKHRP